jgi:hypothetical protein
VIPPEVVTAARYAYFGHRFELPLIGWHEELWVNDLVAAYAWATTYLRCFAHGTWVQPVFDERSGFEFRTESCPTVALVSWSVPLNRTRPWGPFPWRYPDGATCYPRKGAGWVWHPEFEAARQIWPAHCFKVHDAWTFLRSCDHDPWKGLHGLLAARDEFPPLKRFLNALPGKLAQSRPEPGPWFDPVSAGLVTSIVRGRMLGELARAGRHAVACVADAIWTSRPIKSETGTHPGSWRPAHAKGVLCVQPGLSFSGGDVMAAQGTPAAALKALSGQFRTMWDIKGLEAYVDVAYDHFVGVREGLAAGVPIGTWTRANHRVRFDPLRKREAWDARAIPAGDSFHMATLPPAHPDPNYFYQGPGDPPKLIGGVPLSSPYWLDDGTCLTEAPDPWPSDTDELVDA